MSDGKFNGKRFDEDRSIKFSRWLNHVMFDEMCDDNSLTLVHDTYEAYFTQLDNALLDNGENSGEHIDVGGPMVCDKESE